MADEGALAGWQRRAQDLEGQLASVRAEVRMHLLRCPVSSVLQSSRLSFCCYVSQADAARITTDNLVEVRH
jgi:hypothetical protein